MATHYARKPLPIDHTKSTRWALASLGSVGVGLKGPAGVSLRLFDLLNLKTGRAHRLEWKGGSGSMSPVPVSASIGKSDYFDFTTPRPVNFFDFDGAGMSIIETSVGVYTWTDVTMLDTKVTVKGKGLSTPDHVLELGVAKILFSDGKPVGGEYVLEPEIEPRVSEPLPVRVRLHAQEDDAGILLPGDMLFDFDQYRLKETTETHQILWKTIQAMEKSASRDHGWLIEGHTDSIGSQAYNKRLGKRRAESVANWILQFKPGWRGDVKTVSKGEERPIASNATKEGRARNRRVEVWRLPMKYWKDYVN